MTTNKCRECGHAKESHAPICRAIDKNRTPYGQHECNCDWYVPVIKPAGVSLETVLDMVRSDNDEGACIDCGAEHDNIEPDAERYECSECGSRAVYGAEQLMLMPIRVKE